MVATFFFESGAPTFSVDATYAELLHKMQFGYLIECRDEDGLRVVVNPDRVDFVAVVEE